MGIIHSIIAGSIKTRMDLMRACALGRFQLLTSGVLLECTSSEILLEYGQYCLLAGPLLVSLKAKNISRLINNLFTQLQVFIFRRQV